MPTLPALPLRLLRLLALAAVPVLREAFLMAIERWARRQRGRILSSDFGGSMDEGDDPWPEDEAAWGPPSLSLPDFGSPDPGAGPTLITSLDPDSKPADSEAGTSKMVPDSPASTDFSARVAHPDNLQRAWSHVRRKRRTSPGSDGQTVAGFETDLERELDELAVELATRRYRPRPLRCFSKKKSGGGGGRREIGIPTIRDRVAQTAMRQILELSVETTFSPWSFAYRTGRGCHEALESVDRLLAEGRRWIVRADVADCFDRIPHRPLLAELEARMKGGTDRGLSDLVGAVLTGPRRWGKRLRFPRRGVPQGSPLSPFLANLYLDAVDRALRDAGHGSLRYADDLLIACRDESEARDALSRLEEALRDRGLALNPAKSRISAAHGEEGFEFLGHRYLRGDWEPLPGRIDQLRARLRDQLREKGGAGRARAAVTLRGWLAYYGRRGGSVVRGLRRRLRALEKSRAPRRHGDTDG